MTAKKFVCSNCGNCCKKFVSENSRTFEGAFFGAEKKFVMNQRFMTLYDWEAEALKKKLAEIGSNRKIVPTSMNFDLKNDQAIILNYSFDKGECPFHETDRCTIYPDRPWICRQFPCLHKTASMLTGETDKIMIVNNRLCPVEEKDWPFVESGKGLFTILEQRYGQAFYFNIASKMLARKKSELIEKLEKEGRIRLAKRGYDTEKLLLRIEHSRKVNLSEFYKEETGIDMLKSFDLIGVLDNLRKKYG